MPAGKHGGKKADTQEIAKLKDLDEVQAEIVYDDEEEAEQDEIRRVKIPKAVYRVGIILIVVILGLILWINRANLTPGNIWNWVKQQTMGTGQGDGYPVPVTGNNVSASNFVHDGSSLAVLSDTAFTMLNSTGREIVSVRHSFDDPALVNAGGNYLLYNAGSTGYLLQSGSETLVQGNAESDLLAGAVSQSGRFALGRRGSDCASRLEVYLKNGTLQYDYQFGQDYITAVALNSAGTKGAVCTVRSEKGELVSTITILDFTQTTPVSEYRAQGTLLLDVSWTENDFLYAVGDTSLYSAKASDYSFVEYSYGGRQVTAYDLENNKAFVSVSPYEHAGACTLMVYSGADAPVEISTDDRVKSISAFGGTVGVLVGNEVAFFDSATGQEQGSVTAGMDVRSIALENESRAYILGVSEIRKVSIS